MPHVHLDKKHLMLFGGIAALVLLYLYWRSRQAAAQQGSSAPSDTIGTPQDQAASDFSSLAGQEQGDIAGLQGQEMSDVGNLQSAIEGLAAEIAGMTPQTSASQAPDAQVPGVAAGQHPQHHAKAYNKWFDAVWKSKHQKTGRKHVGSSSPHVNAHHPAGTAGHSVARRSHDHKDNRRQFNVTFDERWRQKEAAKQHRRRR